eukprot:UN02133
MEHGYTNPISLGSRDYLANDLECECPVVPVVCVECDEVSCEDGCVNCAITEQTCDECPVATCEDPDCFAGTYTDYPNAEFHYSDFDEGDSQWYECKDQESGFYR